MNVFLTILLVILVILIIAFGVIYFLNQKLTKKQAESQAMMEAAAQTITMLVIDKKKMKLKEASLPKIVYEQTPKYLRWNKVPIVKAKVGPKVMTFIADEKVFQMLPIKTEVKAVVSGLYITSAKGIRGPLIAPPKKKGLLGRFKKAKSEN